MNELFLSGFTHMLEALLRLFIIIFLAGVLVRKQIISSVHITALSDVTIIVLLPALVLSNTLLHFNPAALPYWWVLPLLGIGMSLLGLGFASLLFFKSLSEKKNMLALASMQNAGYLVLPVGQMIYPDKFNEFAMLTFLFILGYNPVLWTLGKQLITGTSFSSGNWHWKQIITPPAAANLFSLGIVLLGWQNFFPDSLVQSFDFLGKAAVPVATFVLGATLGTITLKKIDSITDTLKVLTVKYLMLPLSVIGLLWFFKTAGKYPLLSDFLIIQAAAAPATGLILQVRSYGGQRKKVAQIMLIAYLFCLLALPFWIALWHSLNF